MPTAMAHDHIISWSNPGDVVLDPFAGSGTTGIQALQLGRRFVGTEIAPEYFAMMQTELRNLKSLSNLILPQVDNPTPSSNNSGDK